MRLAAVQFSPYRYGSPADARVALDSLMRRAAVAGAELVVAPEMATTRYVLGSPAEAAAVAEPPDGPTHAMVDAIAREFGCWISCGFVERSGEGLHNAVVLAGPSGERAIYRKVFLFELDRVWASAGNAWLKVATPFGTVMPLICMDLNHRPSCDEVRACAPQVVAFSTAWLDEGLDVLRYWRYRLAGWSGYFVAANTWGCDGSIGFRGRSAVLGPGDFVSAVGPATGDAVILADTDTGTSIVMAGEVE